jgi:hypothetical protein
MKQIERVAYAAKSAGSTSDVQENKSDVIYVRIIGFVWSRLGWNVREWFMKTMRRILSKTMAYRG